MSSIENSEEVGSNKTKRRSKWYRAKRLFQRYPLGAIGSFIVLLVVFAAVFDFPLSTEGGGVWAPDEFVLSLIHI